MKKKVKIRKSWGTLNPVTRIVPNDKKYNRNKSKRDFRKELKYFG